jgi:F0F1-type ATP synthase membrane subunit b/b'
MASALLDPNFWILVSFSLFVGGAFLPAKRKSRAFFSQRQEGIRQQFQEAEEILMEASRLDTKAAHYLDEVEAQIQEILVLAEREVGHLKEKMRKEKAQIRLTHAQFLEAHQQVLAFKLEQELRQALLTRAFRTASELFASNPPPLGLNDIEATLQKGTQFSR